MNSAIYYGKIVWFGNQPQPYMVLPSSDRAAVFVADVRDVNAYAFSKLLQAVVALD